MPAILSRLSILFSYISRDLDNTKILLYKLSVRYLVVKPVCVNAALALKLVFKLLVELSTNWIIHYLCILHYNITDYCFYIFMML